MVHPPEYHRFIVTSHWRTQSGPERNPDSYGVHDTHTGTEIKSGLKLLRSARNHAKRLNERHWNPAEHSSILGHHGHKPKGGI